MAKIVTDDVPFDHQICFILHGNKELLAVVSFVSVYILTERELLKLVKNELNHSSETITCDQAEF